MMCRHRNPNVTCTLPDGHLGGHWDGGRHKWPDTRPPVAWIARGAGSIAIVASVIMAFDEQFGVAALCFGTAALWNVAAAIHEWR